MADPPPARIPPPKIPAPAKFSGEGDDLKPDKLKRGLLSVEPYISRHRMTEANTPDIVVWYGGLTEGRAEGAFLTFMKDREQPPTLCNDPTIGSYNHYHLRPNGIPRGNQRWYGLVYFIQIAGKPWIRPRG